MTEIRLKNVEAHINGAAVLDDVKLSVSSGELVALVGPNGAGKSSMLKAIQGILKPSAGSITINGLENETLSPGERARLISYLPQMRPLVWPLRVRDAIALGRYAFGVGIGSLSEHDRAVIDKTIEDCELGAFRDRSIDSLSGGELTRVHCARAFAAQTPLLLADEPIASLDPAHQFGVMALIKKFVGGGGGALVVLHDISLAARYADRLVWMNKGKITADGSPEETITDHLMREVFGIESLITSRDGHVQVTINGPAVPG